MVGLRIIHVEFAMNFQQWMLAIVLALGAGCTPVAPTVVEELAPVAVEESAPMVAEESAPTVAEEPPPPIVEEPDLPLPPPDMPVEASPVAEEPVPEFSEDTPRGTAIVTRYDTFGAASATYLKDVKSYAAQGDQEAVASMLDGYYPKAVALPTNYSLIFEGCVLRDCSIVMAREPGSSSQIRVEAADLAIDRR